MIFIIDVYILLVMKPVASMNFIKNHRADHIVWTCKTLITSVERRTECCAETIGMQYFIRSDRTLRKNYSDSYYGVRFPKGTFIHIVSIEEYLFDYIIIIFLIIIGVNYSSYNI